MPWLTFSFVLVLATAVLPVVARDNQKTVPSRDAPVVRSVEPGLKKISTPNRTLKSKTDTNKQNVAAASAARQVKEKEKPVQKRKIAIQDCEVTIINDIEVAAQGSGVIVQTVVREGDKVKKGQVLARIDDTDAKLKLAEAKARFAVARPNRSALAEAVLTVKQAAADYERAKQLSDEQQIPRSQATKLKDELEIAKLRQSAAEENLQRAMNEQEVLKTAIQLAERNLERQTCQSPIDGIIVKIKRHAGESIEVGKPFFQIINMDRLAISAFVDGNNFIDLKRSEVMIEFRNPRSGKPIAVPGKVIFVSPFANRTTREISFRAEFENPLYEGETLIHPGMIKRGEVFSFHYHGGPR